MQLLIRYSLLIASQIDPVRIIQRLEPYLKGSRPIVIYATIKESLHEVAAYMRQSNRFINVQLTESWLREYQTSSAKGGTHPHMTTLSSGGYLLKASTIVASTDTQPLIHFKKQKRGR
jgi:tRNA (adenine-N(1)-)-methyltransferase non-catalytic subunit